jgi:N-dimethylarginine dimethylaminohydrolase
MVTAGDLEGGDFMVLQPGAAVCGFSGERSIEPAVRQFEWLRSKRIRVISIPYADAMQLGSNVVALGSGRVMVPAASKNLIAACRAEGLTVYDPDVSMIGKGGGAVHCMCQALKRDPAARR